MVDSYMLGPGDAVQVELLDVPEYSGVFSIGPDGTLYLPRLRALRRVPLPCVLISLSDEESEASGSSGEVRGVWLGLGGRRRLGLRRHCGCL